MFLCLRPVFWALIFMCTDEVIYAEPPADRGGARLDPLILNLIPVFVFLPPAVCDPGAHAGADVQTQDVQPQPQRLPQDLSLPEMAEDGGTTR